ncbi:MAG: fumarylacetoacetate hydrolase family protein [Candidatus Nanopelagicales bacterium]|jgi:2-keto-4-pentenoate hydratase/2-oxohepta-3-ene-1,7-dioic acid hydratase in catechol pathway
MKLVTYRGADGERPGILHDDGQVVDTARAASRAGIELPDRSLTNRDVVSLDGPALTRLASAAEDESPVDFTSLGPPVTNPEKIVCLGLNYIDHAEEVGASPPASPMFFAKFPNSLAGPADDIVPPRTTRQVDYEAELALVIGRSGRYIDPRDAWSYVAGAMALNDVSARDLQLANPLWTSGKAVDTFAPCGPALVTLDELGDPQNLRIGTRINGTTVQDGTTASMIFPIPTIISFLSEVMTLRPGDIIATGTPAGVGVSRNPQLFLSPGDIVEVEIERIGILCNRIASAESAHG